jgi:hypothetical protein
MAPVSIPESLERALASRVVELPPATQNLLLVAAPDERGGLRAHLGAAGILEAPGTAILDELP